MVDAIADKLLLVLSTDWFSPYWPSIGLYVSREKKVAIQRLLREEVRKSFLGKTYWRAAFDTARITCTNEALFAAFSSTNSEVTKQALQALVAKGPPALESGREIWLLSTMTEMLVNSGDESLPDEIVGAVRKAWELSQLGSTNLREVCQRSGTEWDQSVRSLTPDLPCWLADVVSEEIEVLDHFGLFWSELQQMTSAALIEKLRQWFKVTSLSLTGEEIDLQVVS